MTYERIKELAEGVAVVINQRIDRELEVLKADYTAELKDDYENEDEDASYADFDEYLKDRADEHLEFALVPYLEGILKETVNITQADLESLPKAEREQITLGYLDYFKEKTGLGNISEDL